MKMKTKILPWMLVVFWCIGAIVWGFFISDFSNGGEMTTNDIINIIFFVVFLGAIIISLLKLGRVSKLTDNFSSAYEKLHSFILTSNKNDYETVDKCFSDSKLSSLYQAYKDEYSRLDTNMPNGCKCNIEDYLNESNFSDYMETDLLNQFPGILTGFGMLGTFVGLTVGLVNLGSFEAATYNIESLMSCIQLAFVTSIFGLILSITFNIVYRLLLKELSENIDLFINEYHCLLTDSEHDGINMIIENQNEQTGAIIALADNISETVSATISEQIKHMEDTYLSACELLKESQIKGMEVLVDQFTEKFTEKLLGTIPTEIHKLEKSIEETCKYQEQSTEKIKENLDAIISLSDNTTEIHRLSVETVEKLKDYTDHLDENTTKLTDQVRANSDSVLQSAANYEKLVMIAGVLSNTTKDLGAYAESMKNYNDDTAEAFDNMVEKFGEISTSFIQQQQVLSDIGAGMKESVVDAITSVINASKQQVTSIEAATEVQKNEIAQFSSDAIKSINTAVEGYETAMERVSENFEAQTNEVRKECNTTIAQFEDVLKNYSDDLQNKSAEISGQIRDMNNAANQVPVVISEFKTSLEDVTEIMSDHIQKIDATVNQIPVVVGEYKSTIENATELISGQIKNLDVSLNQIPAVVNDFKTTAETINESLYRNISENTVQTNRPETMIKPVLDNASEDESGIGEL